MVIKTMNENSPKICSVETGNFLFHYIIEQQTCFLTLTEKQFSKKTANSFLEDLAGEFHSQYGHNINTATRPYSFIEFDT
jgi:vesicle transport protein SEC22